MKTLVLLADINSITGYGKHAIQIARDFKTMGYAVKIRAASRWEPSWGEPIPDDIKAMFVEGPQPEPVELLLHPPNFVPTPGKRTIYFTMHETTRIKPLAVSVLNKAECVVVPCQMNAESFKECGVTVPIHKIPLGIDDNLFRYRPMPNTNIIRFGCAGRTSHGGVRKGLDEVIEAFAKAFDGDDNVRLDVKCFPDCKVKYVADDRIAYHRTHWTDKQLADWYASIHCFVSAAKGEGWGLMQHQAIATGRPLISIQWGGVAEFFGDHSGLVVKHRLEPARAAYEGQGDWAVPDFDSLCDSMKAMVGYLRTRNPETFPGVIGDGVRQIASTIARNFSWADSNLALSKIVDAISGET